jgi:hypothetical protein
MYRSLTKRLATMTVLAQLATAGCAVFATATVCEAFIIDGMQKKAHAERLEFAAADARSAMAHCGAYDVFIVGHDFASADDAQKAALSYLGDGCDYQRGLPRKG